MGRAFSNVARAELVSEIKGLMHELRKALLDTYRPELHYMRGRPKVGMQGGTSPPMSQQRTK
jgi:hypothetical protein